MKFFSKTLSILISLFIGVKSQEFFGCYEYDVANMEFLTFASHLDPNLATPALCSKACDSMGLPFSAITSSMFCFCRLTAPTASVKVSDDTCYSSGMCTADTNQYCGHSKYMLVYTGDTTVEMTPNTDPSSLNLFDSLTYTYNGSTPAKNLIIKSNGLISGYQPLYGTATIFFTQTGITTLEATSSGGLMKDSNSQRIVIPSPTVKDDLSNYTLDCPLSGLNDEIFRCDLRFNKGIGTVLNIDFNDATTQSANLPDTELYAFGIPVPQKISTTLLNKSTGSSVNLLYNTFFKTDGILRAVEIYAETAGSIDLNIYAHSTCSSQYSSLKSPQSSCGDLKTSSTFGCTSSFMKGLERCDTDDAGQKNFYNIPSTSFTQIKTEPITLTAGYNLIQPFGGATGVKQGWILGLVQNTGRVSIDASGKAPVSDYTDASPLLNSTCNGAFHIRAFVSKPTIFSSSNLYTLVKNYTLSASITSPINIAAKTASFAIYERIQELSVITDNGQCQVDVECTFTATTLKGSGITYEWRLPSINTTTTTAILKHTFTSNGVFDIILFAYNPVSNETYFFTIKVLIVVSKPKLFASSLFSTDSSSIVGKNAEFLFTLKTGLGYTCTINWGDLSTEKFDDSLSPKNNTIFVHLYAREANYNVSIYCENSISNDFSSIIHSAQHEITNLRLTRWFSFRNIQFSVEFALDFGTSPEFQMTYNGQTDSVTYNSVSRTGAGSPRIGTSSG
ncbi:unnamed protein product [Brachionus calyciflorus]|uniref:WSC domain-containing protein n=1 Tax=Brachionus calyciflorus TaxID=104777 RepID=A0A813Y0P9_9BILA|nr:unnamed protein product [Brachionus calyciflorus]